jgi:hypothetical protein
MDPKNNVILVARVEDDDEKQQEKDENDIDVLIEYAKENGEIKVEKTELLTNETKSVEKLTYIGHVEDNKHFEEEPSVPSPVLQTILNGYSKKKTNIYEVAKSVITFK